MTEDEAKTKWCPFSRVSKGPEDNNASNRASDGEDEAGALLSEAMCIGSACMAWRKTCGASDPLRHSDGSLTFAHPAEGFCGLAGSPQ